MVLGVGSQNVNFQNALSTLKNCTFALVKASPISYVHEKLKNQAGKNRKIFMSSTISAETALVYLMVVVSASDNDMTDSELKRIGDIVRSIRPFLKYDEENLVRDAENCAEILGVDDGLEAVLGLVMAAIPTTHIDTAYAMACEIAVADGRLQQEELRILAIIRDNLGLDRLTASAIERGAAARAKVF